MSLNAQRAFFNSNAALETAFERLSTGNRVNSAVDDAAGLAIGNHLVACSDTPSETQNKDKIMTLNTNHSPIAICTWAFANANAKAGAELSKGTKALDAAIAGVAVESGSANMLVPSPL